MQTHLSLLRDTLRKNHGLPSGTNPIRREGRGNDAVYWLDLLYQGEETAKAPRGEKGKIKRKLSARREGN